MRFAALIAALSLAASGWCAGPRLAGGDVIVPLPPGWVVWSDDEIALANTTVPEGQTILAQGAAHRFGHSGFNSTVTLSRLGARSTGARQQSARAAAEVLLDTVVSDAPGFAVTGNGVEVIDLNSGECALWRGALPVTAGAASFDVHIAQAVIGVDSERYILTGLTASGEMGLDLTWMLERMRAGSETALRPGMFGLPIMERALWGIGGFKLPVPEGWSAWIRTAADNVSPEDTAVRSGIAREDSTRSGFTPTMAVESPRGSGGAPTLLSECRRTSEQLVGMISDGAWLREPERLTVGGREAAWAWIAGVVPVHRTIVPVQLCDLWIADGDRMIRLVAVMERGDQETMDTLESLLNMVDEMGM